MSKSTRFQARAHFFKQTRCREDEISCKSRSLDSEFAGKSANALEILYLYSNLKVSMDFEHRDI